MKRRTDKSGIDRGSGRLSGLAGATGNGRQAYVIRIPREADQERALQCFDGVREAVHSNAEDEFLVSGEHLDALRKAGVPFEDITDHPANHGQDKAG